MAGMKVIVVKTDDLGNIDWNDLKDKVCKFKNNLSALMITYPLLTEFLKLILNKLQN